MYIPARRDRNKKSGTKLNPPMVKPFWLTYLPKGVGGGGGVATHSGKLNHCLSDHLLLIAD